MTAPVPPDDIVGLFQKFDGDAGSYRKFASPAAPEPTAEWPLLASPHTGAAPSTGTGPAQAEPTSPAMPSARLAPLLRHAAASAAAPSLPVGAATAGNDARMAPLQQLFERLAQQPPASSSPPVVRHGLLRSWRRQA